MNVTFKAFMCKEWTLTDDRIFVGKKEILLSSIIKATHNRITPGNANGVIQVFYGSGAFDFATLAYPKKQQEDGEKAATFILAKVEGVDAEAKVKERERIQKEGYRKICNVCGHIFVYTDEDINKNIRHTKSAVGSSIAGVAGALGGYYGASSVNTQSANDELNRIIDYSRCPKCGSANLSDVTDEDIARNKQPAGGKQAVSSADELKKFKELLDSGIITQEEFDTKKKQLLGL